MNVWDTIRLSNRGPKYLALCDAIAEAIRRGQLGPGRKLPSHRGLARKLGLSVGTVTRAYQQALDRGLIAAEVGRGSFVCERSSPPVQVDRPSHSFDTRVDLSRNSRTALTSAAAAAWAQALTELGRPSMVRRLAGRREIEITERNQRSGARWIRRTGLTPAQANIFDCAGPQAALCAVVAATTAPGDIVAAASLTHPYVRQLVHRSGLDLRSVATDLQGLVPEAFEELCRNESPRLLYCIPAIHDPTTATLPVERRRRIAEIAGTYGVLIVEDERSGFVSRQPLLPVAAFAPTRSFLIADVGTALSPALRTAYILAPRSWAEALSRSLATTSGVAAMLESEIVARWVDSGIENELLLKQRLELEARNKLTREILASYDLRSDPVGYHVWLCLPAPLTAGAFCRLAMRRGVAVVGSNWFAVTGTAPEAVRICIGGVSDPDELRWALGQLKELLDETASAPHAVESE